MVSAKASHYREGIGELLFHKLTRCAAPLSAGLKEVEAGGEVDDWDRGFFGSEELLALEVVDRDCGMVGRGDVEVGGGGVGVEK